MSQKFNKTFYDSKEWKMVRESILIRDGYMCRYCGRVATDVHHIIHLTPENINDKRITSGADNLVSLCGRCHKSLHANEQKNGQTILQPITFDENGFPIEAK